MAGIGNGNVSVVVPTRNEAGNVGPLVRRIEESAGEVVVEVIFVDDSDDKTPQVVERVSRAAEVDVRLIRREPGQRAGGLGTAVLMGIEAAETDWVLVMDGDLQHPPEIIPDMVAAARGDVRLVVASRRRGDHQAVNAGPLRRAVTNATTWVTKALFPGRLAGITDPLTGFFLVDRRAIAPDLQPDGFKILLEILARSRNLDVAEIGFTFGDRVSGRSKASFEEGVRFLKLLARLRFAAGRDMNRTRSSGLPGHRYDVHGVLTVASEVKLPELEWFRTDAAVESPDVVVRIGKPSAAPTGMEFKEWFGWAGFAVRIAHDGHIDVAASRLVGLSPHVLYTNVVEPILRWEFVRRGHALVHSACVVSHGLAYLVTARTDTGKTTTALKLLDEGGDLEFLSDDLSLVTPTGELLTYPKPMTMSYHTVQAVNPAALTPLEKVALQPQSRLHSRSGRRIGLGLAKSAFPAATANAIAQAIIPPPKYPVDRILPGTTTAPSGLPVHLFVIARGPESKRRLGWEESTEMLLANCEDAYGFPPYRHVEEYLLGESADDLRALESEIILRALEGCPATLLQSETYAWGDQIRIEIEADRAMRNGEVDADVDVEAGGVRVIIDLTDKVDRADTPLVEAVDDDSAGAVG